MKRYVKSAMSPNMQKLVELERAAKSADEENIASVAGDILKLGLQLDKQGLLDDWRDGYLNDFRAAVMNIYNNPNAQLEDYSKLIYHFPQFYEEFEQQKKSAAEKSEKKKKAAQRKPKGGAVTLEAMCDPYDRYTSRPPRKITVKGVDLLDALRKLCDKMLLYLNSEEIDERELSPEQIIDEIETSNGDGCDYVFYIKNVNTGEILLEGDTEGYEDWQEMEDE